MQFIIVNIVKEFNIFGKGKKKNRKFKITVYSFFYKPGIAKLHISGSSIPNTKNTAVITNIIGRTVNIKINNGMSIGLRVKNARSTPARLTTRPPIDINKAFQLVFLILNIVYNGSNIIERLLGMWATMTVAEALGLATVDTKGDSNNE